jgi:hypothetical protein
MVPSGFFDDPLTNVDYILKNFVHLERGLLMDLVTSSLEYVRVSEVGRENAADHDGFSKKPLRLPEGEQGYVLPSSKRAPEEFEYDHMQFG